MILPPVTQVRSGHAASKLCAAVQIKPYTDVPWPLLSPPSGCDAGEGVADQLSCMPVQQRSDQDVAQAS